MLVPTCAGAWEEASEDLDLFAGKWYTKEEFLEMYLNESGHNGTQDLKVPNTESGDSAVELLMPSADSNIGTRQRLDRGWGGGEKRNGRGDFKDMDVWGERLGEIWALQDWNARPLEQQRQRQQQRLATGELSGPKCGNQFRHCVACEGPESTNSHRVGANADEEARDTSSRYEEAADRLCHVLAMTGPLLMAQLIPAWEAVFPGTA
jgi:hypothetical protein